MQENPEIAALTEAIEAPAESEVETRLSNEIEQLWSVHSQAQAVLGHTKEELRTLRLELGRSLYEMKVLLACPGRGGQWSKFLSAQCIPRATADRYAKSYEIALNPPGEIDSTEAIKDSPDDWVQKVMQGCLAEAPSSCDGSSDRVSVSVGPSAALRCIAGRDHGFGNCHPEADHSQLRTQHNRA